MGHEFDFYGMSSRQFQGVFRLFRRLRGSADREFSTLSFLKMCVLGGMEGFAELDGTAARKLNPERMRQQAPFRLSHHTSRDKLFEREDGEW